MKPSQRNFLFRPLIGLALTGAFTAVHAAPTLFTATATVQNAVNISQTTALNFGDVFASKTNTGATADNVDATASHKLTLSPTGTMTLTQQTFSWANPANAPGPLFAMGGHSAGVFTAPGVPSGAVVQVEITNANGNLINNAPNTAQAECVYDTTTAALNANKIILTASGDPNAGFFCLDAFTSNLTGLIGTGPTQTTAGYTIPFATTTLNFNLGATLVMQAVQGNGVGPRLYSAAPYSGQFGLEVVFK